MDFEVSHVTDVYIIYTTFAHGTDLKKRKQYDRTKKKEDKTDEITREDTIAHKKDEKS